MYIGSHSNFLFAAPSVCIVQIPASAAIKHAKFECKRHTDLCYTVSTACHPVKLFLSHAIMSCTVTATPCLSHANMSCRHSLPDQVIFSCLADTDCILADDWSERDQTQYAQLLMYCLVAGYLLRQEEMFVFAFCHVRALP